MHGCTKTLIVAPNDVLETWTDELELEGVPHTSLRGWSTRPKPGWNLTSYASLRRNWHLQSAEWDCVILDESLNVRNPKAQITKVCLSAFRDVPHKAVLCGTPAPESHLEYFCQMQFLFDTFLGYDSYWKFRLGCFDQIGYDWHPKQGTLHRIINSVHNNAHCLSRRDAGMGRPESLEKRHLDFPASLRRVYRHAEKTMDLGERETKWVPVLRTWLHRLAGGFHPEIVDPFKAKYIDGMLRTDLKGEQVVIWCTFNSEIDGLLRQGLPGRIGVIKGSVRPAERARINKRFQDHKLDVLICQTKCAQLGRNFSAASTNIFFSLPLDVKSWLQSRDRIVHPSKTGGTLTLTVLARDTVDEDIYASLLDKRSQTMSLFSLIRQNYKDRVK